MTTYTISQDIYNDKNIINIITNHQYGLQTNSSYQSDVIKLKVRQLRISLDEFEIDPDLTYCKILRNADNGCLIGVWQKNMDPASRHSSTYHLKFEYNRQFYDCKDYMSCPIVSDLSCNGPFFKRMDVTDVCERSIGGQSFLLYVGNTAVSGGRMILNISNIENSSEEVIPETVWQLPKCVWSCASNSEAQYAAGTENSFYIFNHKHNVMKEVDISTKVFALEFNKDGNLLYCATKEYLLIYDTRQRLDSNIGNSRLCNRLGLNGIREIKELSDENTMIVCGMEGSLWKIDLRMKRFVLQYPEYFHHEDERRPFSVNEDLDLLCATDDDQVTRIWSLQSGDLLTTLRPFLYLGRPDAKTISRFHSCIVADQRRWFVAVVHSNILTPMEY